MPSSEQHAPPDHSQMWMPQTGAGSHNKKLAINRAMQVKLWDLQTRTCAQVGAGLGCAGCTCSALTCPATHTPALRTWSGPTTCPRNLALPPQTVSEHSDQVWGVRFRQDGTRLASVSDDRSVCLFDFAA